MQDLPQLVVGSSSESRALVVVCGRCVAHPTFLFLPLNYGSADPAGAITGSSHLRPLRARGRWPSKVFRSSLSPLLPNQTRTYANLS